MSEDLPVPSRVLALRACVARARCQRGPESCSFILFAEDRGPSPHEFQGAYSRFVRVLGFDERGRMGRAAARARRVPRADDERRKSQSHGFTLVEVCITLTVSVLVLYALHSGTRTAIDSRRAIDEQYRIQRFADEVMERLRRLPFGAPSASAPSPGQLAELFDADTDLGNITFSHLRVDATAHGHSFRVASDGTSASWRVRVTSDLNGDGDNNDDRENRHDLLRCELYYNDRLVIETLRCAEASVTSLDSTADYLVGIKPPPAPGGGEGGGGGSEGGGDSGTTIPPPGGGSGPGTGVTGPGTEDTPENSK